MDRLGRLFHSIGTIILSFIRLFYAPGRTRDFLSYVYIYRPLPYDSRIKCATLPEIIPGIEKTAVVLRKCFPQHGNMTGDEIIVICLLVRWTNPSGIFEFGTFNGNTTLQMALNAPADCAIYTLNLPLDHGGTQLPSSAQDRMVHPRNAGSGQAFRDEPEQTRITELFGDSATYDYTPYFNRCNFILVDAGHEYNYVKSDTENAFKLLPPEGGVIVWHDFPNAPGVCAWIEELSTKRTIYHIRNTRLALTFIGRPACTSSC